MTCPHCKSVHTSERPKRTELGYRRFLCRRCGREFNERTGTPFNRLQYPSDVVCLVVLWRLRHALLWRQSSYGTQSQRGSRFVEAILTVVSSCQQQGRNVLAYLTACCRAFSMGRVGPSLLPRTSSSLRIC